MTTEGMLPAGTGRTFSVGPSQVLVKVENGEPDQAFSLIEWTIPPGAPAPPKHIHREGSETFYVLEGELEFLLADGSARAPAGTSFHIPPGTPHTLSNPGEVPAKALEFFVPGSLMGLVEGVGEVFAAGMPPDRDRLMAIFEQHASQIVG